MPLPHELAERLKRISLDKFNGNLQLHIKDGRILAFRVEEVVNVKP